jgi:hypothetical protein
MLRLKLLTGLVVACPAVVFPSNYSVSNFDGLLTRVMHESVLQLYSHSS